VLCAMLFSLWIFPLIFARTYRKFDAKYGDRSDEKRPNK
jgi:hypothetical protein